ncbi:MAG TPA: ADP-forming succinate--CoA ligase subunit beta [bacterium]|nr:ADP-forming succinate--CoA ligase subunit beta [bacterium]
MKIHEYQAKEILRKFGVPTLNGKVAFNADDAEKAAKELGTAVVVVKSQIHAGGRGKGRFKEFPDVGGVKVAKSPSEAKDFAKKMIGSTLVTIQTGSHGQVVRKVYVEQGCDIGRELYLGMTLDRATSRVTIMASTEGGMEIEEVAHKTPEKIHKVGVDPAIGFQAWQGRKLAFALGLDKDVGSKFAKFCAALYEAYVATDASLAEINPLVVTKQGEVIALDAKWTIDDNAEFRHKELLAYRDPDEETKAEQTAHDLGINYVQLDGNVGCMVNGAGLAMATMDVIKMTGGAPANFLDVGGGATEEQITQSFKLIVSDPNVKAILINIFGGIMKCDVVAQGVVNAAKKLELKIPVVVRLEGTNVEQGKKILADSGMKLTPADGIGGAAAAIKKVLGT